VRLVGYLKRNAVMKVEWKWQIIVKW